MKKSTMITSLMAAGIFLITPTTANAMSKKSVNYWSKIHYVRLSKPITIDQYKIKHRTISKITAKKHLKRGTKVYVALDKNAKSMWNIMGNNIKQSKNKVWFARQNGTKWLKVTKMPKVRAAKTYKINSYWQKFRYVQLTRSIKVYRYQVKNHTLTNKILSTRTLKRGYRTLAAYDPNINGFWSIVDNNLKQTKSSEWFTRQPNTKWMKEIKIQAPTYKSKYQTADNDIPSDHFVSGYLPFGNNLVDGNGKTIADSNTPYQFEKQSDGTYVMQANGQNIAVKVGTSLWAPVSTKQTNVMTSGLDKANLVFSQYAPSDHQAVVPSNFKLNDGLKWIISNSAKKVNQNQVVYAAYVYSSKQHAWNPEYLTFKQ